MQGAGRPLAPQKVTQCHHSPAPTVLSPKQLLAVQLIAQGLTRKRVASQLEMDPGTLSRWRRHTTFKHELAMLLEQSETDCIETFRATKLLAVERLTALVNSPNPTVALKAVDLVLQRTNLSVATGAPAKSYRERSDAQFERILDELLMA